MPKSKKANNLERRYSVEELSQRWGKPNPTILEWIRTVQFQQIGATVKLDGRIEMISLFFQDEEGEWKHRGTHQATEKSEECEFVVYRDPREFFNGLVYDENQEPFIPETEVLRFEREHNLGSEQGAAIPSSSQFNWIKAPHLKIAVEAYYDLYLLKNIQLNQGHKLQIKKWLDKRYGKLSKHSREIIATLVNINKRGGAPPAK